MRLRHAALALALLSFGCSAGAPKPPSTVGVEIVNRADFAGHVRGNVVRLALRATGLDIVKANGDTSGTTGHFHIFVDRPPVAAGAVIPKEPGIVHSAANPVLLTGLGLGVHHLAVVLGDGAHRRIGDAQAELVVFVDGPTVHIAVPSVVTGGDVRLDLSAEGVRIVKADGDRSGATGHYHVFVDRDPAAAGALIPKEDGIIHSTDFVFLHGLAPGEHRVWVVLGDGTHHAFDPLVADHATFTVTAQAKS